MPKKEIKNETHIKDPFVPFFTHVYKSENYAKLNSNSVKLMFDLWMQFDGKNNGALDAAMSILKPYGWNNNKTLARSIAQLIKYGFIERTRKYTIRDPALYAFTWWKIDECLAKYGYCIHDVLPTENPRRPIETWKPNTKIQPRTRL